MPLPPYIKRPDEPLDHKYYQTVYARKPGSVASPTAGLHFTPALLNTLREKGHGIETVTLHVNLGTFRVVETEDITQHQMHTEEYSLTQKVLMRSGRQKRGEARSSPWAQRPAEVMETIADRNVRAQNFVPPRGTPQGNTDIFIYPGYAFRAVDILITNFHLPRSTLFNAGLRLRRNKIDERGLRASDPGKIPDFIVTATR